MESAIVAHVNVALARTTPISIMASTSSYHHTSNSNQTPPVQIKVKSPINTPTVSVISTKRTHTSPTDLRYIFHHLGITANQYTLITTEPNHELFPHASASKKASKSKPDLNKKKIFFTDPQSMSFIGNLPPNFLQQPPKLADSPHTSKSTETFIIKSLLRPREFNFANPKKKKVSNWKFIVSNCDHPFPKWKKITPTKSSTNTQPQPKTKTKSWTSTLWRAPEFHIWKYSDFEYRNFLDNDTSWTKEATDYLFELCRRFHLHFPVIHDRFSEWREHYPEYFPVQHELSDTYTSNQSKNQTDSTNIDSTEVEAEEAEFSTSSSLNASLVESEALNLNNVITKQKLSLNQDDPDLQTKISALDAVEAVITPFKPLTPFSIHRLKHRYYSISRTLLQIRTIHQSIQARKDAYKLIYSLHSYPQDDPDSQSNPQDPQYQSPQPPLKLETPNSSQLLLLNYSPIIGRQLEREPLHAGIDTVLESSFADPAADKNRLPPSLPPSTPFIPPSNPSTTHLLEHPLFKYPYDVHYAEESANAYKNYIKSKIVKSKSFTEIILNLRKLFLSLRIKHNRSVALIYLLSLPGPTYFPFCKEANYIVPYPSAATALSLPIPTQTELQSAILKLEEFGELPKTTIPIQTEPGSGSEPGHIPESKIMSEHTDPSKSKSKLYNEATLLKARFWAYWSKLPDIPLEKKQGIPNYVFASALYPKKPHYLLQKIPILDRISRVIHLIRNVDALNYSLRFLILQQKLLQISKRNIVLVPNTHDQLPAFQDPLEILPKPNPFIGPFDVHDHPSVFSPMNIVHELHSAFSKRPNKI